MKLSILICTLDKRSEMYNRLVSGLAEQIKNRIGEVQILIESDNGQLSIGAKRNILLNRAEGEYVAFIDDDDEVAPNYIDLLMEGINKGVDCCSLRGIITTDGKDAHYFEHSIKYNEYKTNEGTNFESRGIKYERYPNHISCIKADIAKQFKFPEKNWGEDTDWATQIRDSGLIKTEHYIPEVIYYYKYVNNKQ